MKTECMTVQEFSMLPLQARLKVETPQGVGDYEGITSSGIVKVFIDGGVKEFSWSECKPQIMLRHVLIMEDFVLKWKNDRSKTIDDKFCTCSPEDKHGSTTAWHCNHCGKPEPTETWLNP